MSVKIDVLCRYLREAGASTSTLGQGSSVEHLVKQAIIKKQDVQSLSIEIVGICFPEQYMPTRDAFFWAEHDNIDIQVAEMLGRSGYPVPWSEDEYSYY